MTVQEYEKQIRKHFTETARYHAEAARLQAEIRQIHKEVEEESKRRRQEFEDYRKIDAAPVSRTSKFGWLTEGMALPSMQEILHERFHINVIAPCIQASCNDRNMELDVLASSDDEAYIVEVKSHLKKRSLKKLLRALKNFPDFFPRQRGCKLYGILAAVDASPETRRRVLRHGLYFARIKDDVFRFDVPEGFRPRAFPNPPPD